MLRLGVWNTRGWSVRENENSNFRKFVLEYSNCDIFALTETFLRENERLNIPVYEFYGNNRKRLHRNAMRGSGGVGILLKRNILDLFTCEVLSSEYEGILWIQLKAITTDFCVNVAVCYLPPSGSSRETESDLFFSKSVGGSL